MRVAPGTQLGPYEVIGPLGEGGMGEVYRARDARLRRDVAIKVLPASFSVDPERLSRFEQEARAASALNHPNVLVVHDIGAHEGGPYVVTELLDGTTLREHLRGTPLPVSRAVGYAIDIARGLAAAHDRGIVHRDIKPENLFVTRDGRVKILDFGLAAIVHGEEPSGMTTRQQTEPGMVLGTVGYMSPEQVRGERVDPRSDIFALGVVLYEMLTGQRPFSGKSKIETLSAILTETPPEATSLNGKVPVSLDRIVGRCLEKDAGQRFQSARDLSFALEGAVAQSGQSTVGARAAWGTPSRTRWFIAAVLGGLALLAAAALGTVYGRRGESGAPNVRFEIPAPAHGTLQGILGVSSVISPDGRMLVMVVTMETGSRLFVRALDSPEARPLQGTDGAWSPFWSPDSKSIGFFAPGRLMRTAATGGAPQTICALGETSLWSVGSWGPDDTILIGYVEAPAPDAGSVLKVPASGGQPSVAARRKGPTDGSFGWPSFLPDGRHFLLYTSPRSGSGEIRVGSLDTQDTKTVLHANSRAVYAEPGYVLFVRDGALVAQRFDLQALEPTGAPMVVAEDLLYFRDLGQADFSVSRTGVLAYQAGATASRLVWYKRDGTAGAPIGPPDDFFFFRLSRDGQKVAVAVMDRRAGTTDIRLLDLARAGQASAVTSDASVDWTPVFSPDGQQIAFASARRGAPHVVVKRLTDPGNGEELVTPSAAVQFVTDWADTPDGQLIVYHDSTATTRVDVVAMPLSGARTARPLVQTRADDMDGRISPDGRWLAYASNESGRSEVYVRALNGGADRWQVSSSGGISPRWRRDGKELYYLSHGSPLPFGPSAVDGSLMAVTVTTEGGFRGGIPTRLFPVVARQGQYEPSADGQTFLVNSGSGSAALPITVSLNWARALSR